jgi:hypothetical protein
MGVWSKVAKGLAIAAVVVAASIGAAVVPAIAAIGGGAADRRYGSNRDRRDR